MTMFEALTQAKTTGQLARPRSWKDYPGLGIGWADSVGGWHILDATSEGRAGTIALMPSLAGDGRGVGDDHYRAPSSLMPEPRWLRRHRDLALLGFNRHFYLAEHPGHREVGAVLACPRCTAILDDHIRRLLVLDENLARSRAVSR